MRKIRKKILLILLLVCIISMVAIGLIGLNSILLSSKAQAKDFGEKSAQYNAQIIKTWVDEKSKLLINIREEIMKLDSEQAILNSLYSYSEINDDFISLFIGFEDDSMIDAYGWNPSKNYKPTERPWYKKANSLSHTATTSVYEDHNKNKNVIALATGIKLMNQKGVLAANVYADYLDEIVGEIKYGQNGFVFLLDEQGKIVTGSKSSLDLTLFEAMMNRMKEDGMDYEKNGRFEVAIDDVTYITSVAKIDGYDWRLFLGAPIDDFMVPAKQMITKFLYISLAVLIIIILVDFNLSWTMSAPIEHLMTSISKIAKGNFEQSLIIEGKDEIASLGLEVDKMRLNLKKYLKPLNMNQKC